MFKTVTFAVLLTIVAAKPGGYRSFAAGPVFAASPVLPVAPILHPAPVISAPIIRHASVIAAAPVLHAAPAIAAVTSPGFSTVSQTYKTDIIHPPTVRTFAAAPAIAVARPIPVAPVVHATPIVHAAPITRSFVAPLAYGFATPALGAPLAPAVHAAPAFGYARSFGCPGCGLGHYQYGAF